MGDDVTVPVVQDGPAEGGQAVETTVILRTGRPVTGQQPALLRVEGNKGGSS